jgi:hypothetical protein
MCNKTSTKNRLKLIASVFCFTVFANCANKENLSPNDSCDLSDNTCCTCTATYISVGQTAETKSVCTPAEKQAFITRWTDPLVRVECKR